MRIAIVMVLAIPPEGCCLEGRVEHCPSIIGCVYFCVLLCRAVLSNNPNNFPSTLALLKVAVLAYSDWDGREKSDAGTLENVNWWGREE